MVIKKKKTKSNLIFNTMKSKFFIYILIFLFFLNFIRKKNPEKDTIYILGNGPSLKNVDFKSLKGKNTFCLNSSYKKFEELNFYPTYFGCFDPKLIECHYDKFLKLMDHSSIEKFFFLNENNNGKKQFTKEQEKNTKYVKINFLPPGNEYKKCSFEKFYKMHNSGATAALISILLGYKKIILLGCDGNYVEQISESKMIDESTKTLQITETPKKNPNYWFDNYQEKGEIYSLPDGNECHMKGWEILYQASKFHNVEIINENKESKIPYFNKDKIVYKIMSKGEGKIIINNEVNINLKKKDIFMIYYNNSYQLFLNNENIGTENSLEAIDYQNNNDYDLSIVLPFSLNKTCYESQLNYNYILKEYIRITKDLPNIQLCLTHTEKEYSDFIDKTIKENNINYIFVKNPYNFNLGYNRNLWKYTCNSNKIMFNDIDIPLSEKNLIELIKISEKYDIVKPYDKNLIHTDKKEKDLYIANNIIPNKKPKCLFSITGGVTLFDKKVLLKTGGYEEFNGHGYEDRCLDVIVLNNGYSIKRLNNKIVHLYHPETSFYGGDFDSINKKFYNCCINKDCKDNIHEKCNHIKDTREISNFNIKNNGNLCLFKNPYLNSLNFKNMDLLERLYEINDTFNYIDNNVIKKEYYLCYSNAIRVWLTESELPKNIESYLLETIEKNDKKKREISEKNILFNRENKFTEKQFGFILIIKNRNFLTQLFINQLSKLDNINYYGKLIIIEDESSDNLNIDFVKNSNLNIDYYLVNTGTNWSRSKLINYGLSKNDFKYSIICDVDFVFRKSFFKEFKKHLMKFNFEENILALPIMETKTIKPRKKYDLYGHYYIFDTQKIISNNGYCFDIENHGFEEREFHIRMIYEGMYIHFMKPLYCQNLISLHLSHTNDSRGKLRNRQGREKILKNINNINNFIFKLTEIKFFSNH